MSLAKVVLAGTVASEPEKRYTPNNNVAVTNFVLNVVAVSNRKGAAPQDGSFQLKVTCWRQLADVAAEQLSKGDEIVVEGKLLTVTAQTPDGANKKGFEIEASTLTKLPGVPQPLLVAAGAGAFDSYGGSSAGGGSYEASAGASAAPPSGGGQFLSEELLTEDDIPF